MAEMLVNQYCKVFSTPKEKLKSPHDIFVNHDETEPELCDFNFSVDDLKDLFIVTRLISWSVFFPVDTFRLENVACVEEREYVVLLWKVSYSAF